MYAKVFSQIYDGSLCTEGSWQALVTFQQFLILADRDGVVDMTAQAISRRTTIPIEIIQAGIDELMQPDPHSRTPTEEGKRLLPLSEHRDWGWRVTNYAHYRRLKRDEDRREYHREYWHKRRNSTTDSTPTVEAQPLNPNQPIAEAEAETKKPPLPPAGGVEPLKNFERFWDAWPASQRKVAKAQCQAKWRKYGCEQIADKIIAAVEDAKGSRDWQKNGGEFIVSPLVWLAQQRWEAPTSEAQSLTIPPSESVDAYRARVAKERSLEASRAAPAPFDALAAVRKRITTQEIGQ